MEQRYYIFFRCWQDFTADFPFEKFDDRPDDKINDELEAYTAHHPHDHSKKFRKATHKKAGRLAVALEKRARQRTPRPDGHYRTRRDDKPTKPFEPAQDCSPGCRNAFKLGWIDASLHRFGDPSPSKQQFFMQVEGKELATALVKRLTTQWPANLVPPEDDWREYLALNLRFGCLSASQLGVERQAGAEIAINEMAESKRGDWVEGLQRSCAKEAASFGNTMLDILKPEAEQAGTPPGATPFVNQTDTGDTGMPTAATSNDVRSEPETPAIHEHENKGHNAPPGEWSFQMTGAEAARRLTGRDNARFRDIEPAIKDTGFEKIKGTHKVRIRLDTLNVNDRRKLEKHA